MQSFTVEAEVMKDDGVTVDNSFTGDATVTLYDFQRRYRTITQNNATYVIYYPAERLLEITGRVVNGKFTGSMVLPRYERAKYNSVRMAVYAHRDGTDQMVNGEYDNVYISLINKSKAINDVTAPVVDKMYLNDESFIDGATVPPSSMLYIRATDDQGINTQDLSLGHAMSLKLDGREANSSFRIKDMARVTDGGRTMTLSCPLTDLTQGEHTLEYTVFDIMGNSASRSIRFFVDSRSLVIEGPRSTVDVATFDITSSEVGIHPVVDMKVTDANGRLVWSKHVTSYPFTWDLKDNNGNAVAPGLYHYFGSYIAPTGDYGGTPVRDIVVLRKP